MKYYSIIFVTYLLYITTCIECIERHGECGDGFECIFDQRIVAYGCAPMTNLSQTVCCSIGQGCDEPGQECGKWCVDCSTQPSSCQLESGQIPYCPANGATGEGCVREI